MTTINIYPDCPKPKWMKVGATCYCLGEGQDVFTVSMVLDKAAVLVNSEGYGHGTESFKKLYKNMSELLRRHPEYKKGVSER